MIETSHDRQPRLTLDSRFVQARVTVAQAAALEVLIDGNPVVENARVIPEGLPDDYDPTDYPAGRVVTIFLLRPVRNDPKYWYARLDWATRDTNPWLTHPPRLGDEIRGFVTQYSGPNGVFATTDEGFEAFLHRNNLPVPVKGDIAAVLDIGDGIAAEVVTVDEETLEIVISVAALRRRRDEETRRLRQRAAEGPPEPPSPTLPPPQSLAGKTILVVDNDLDLLAAMVRWLNLHGAKALAARDRASLRAGLAAPTLSHVLLDYMMPDRDTLWSMVAEWQRQKPERRVAVLSADPLATEAARTHGWPHLWKPISIGGAANWILQGVIPPPPSQTIQIDATLAERGGLEEKAVRRRFYTLLDTLCRKHRLAAGLWVLRLRPGKYSLRAWWGLKSPPTEDTHHLLRTTLAANCIDTQKIIQRRIGDTDPLRPLLPEDARHALALPVVAEEGCERALVFYASHDISDTVREDLASYLGEVELLASQMTLIRQMREQETLAATGLQSAGLFHELRHAVGLLALSVDAVTQAIMEDELNPPLGRLQETLERVTDLLDSNLSLVKKQRLHQLDINRTVQRITAGLGRKMAYGGVDLIVRPAHGRPVVNLPPMVLEQPLANLVDNALFHAAKRRHGGRVEVRVEITDDADTPIRVVVEDNGNGMRADERDRLFQARETSKGEDGVGMGLYVSRILARLAGGDVDCLYSWRWIGSAFVIRLPAMLTDHEGHR